MSKIVGIDLGTTFSAIAELDDLGNPEVLSDPETNIRITPSVVYIGNEKVIVGDKAKDAAVTKPKHVITETKRKMEDDVIYSKQEGGWIEKKGKISSKEFTPSQVSSLILSKLKNYTTGVKKAVITVPALFPETARSATLDAAKLAGLDVELINEPTAAVLHYANLPGVSVSGRVLVFDLGGGTFDVSILEVGDEVFEVLATSGDTHLGGDDFDQIIVDYIVQDFKQKEGVDLYQEKFNPVFAGEEPDEIVLDHRKRIDACDTIVLIAPIWNFRMPAIVEGWIDKVLAPPWAFKFKKLWGNYGYPIGNLRDKKAVIFCTYGSPRLAITTFFLNLPIRRLKRGVFHMCGIYNINYRRYFAVPFVSVKKREEFLNDVKKTALCI